MKKIVLLTLLMLALGASARAQITFENAFPNLSFTQPVEFQSPNDGTNRIFVIEQTGRIYVFPNSSAATTTDRKVFLDLSAIVLASPSFGDERGLLGLAFHPNYATNRYFYVYYTENNAGLIRMVLARYETNSSNPDQAIAGSELRLLAFTKNQNNSNHNGGKIGFGPDGYLYASIGDGGGGGDPQRNAQDTTELFGKILRIDPDFKPGNQVIDNYAIPADNPFAAIAATRKEIYAFGVRNTWRFSFDAPTGRMWAGDVGQGQREEINLITNGGNYGWRKYEGNLVYDGGEPTPANAIFPLFEYPHTASNLSITGGYVYRGTQLASELEGKYIYADYVSGRVWALEYDGVNPPTNTLLFQTSGINVLTFGVDQNGEHYFCGFNSIYRLKSGTTPPSGLAVAGVGGWSAIKTGTNGTVNALAAAPNGDVFVGGSFTSAGGVAVNNIAKWNPATGWSSVGTGISGTVNAIAVAPNGDVYAGGFFSAAGGTAANNVAKWNGSWSALGSGTNGYVGVVTAAPNGDIYIGGAFITAGGLAANNIAKWNGSWSALGSTPGTNNEVRSITVSGSDVYAGGNFASAGGVTASCIARYDGANWNALGGGTSGYVQAIALIGSDVYAGGSFNFAGGNTVGRIAKWNGSVWSTLGGLDSPVNALVADGSDLFVGGSFRVADAAGVNARVRSVAKWNATDGWKALGVDTSVGTAGDVNALALIGNRLYTGGNFTAVGGVPATDFAEWQLPDASSTQAVSGNGSVTFAGTGVTIDFSGVTGAGNVTVQRFSTSATSVSGVPDANQSQYRFVITQTGLSAFTALLRFDRSTIPNNGISNPATVTVYRRTAPGDGGFASLTNSYNAGTPNEVRATATAFSEFVFGGGIDNPLPVELTAFTGQNAADGVRLNWTTASEKNNLGFILLRDGVMIASHQTVATLKGNGTTTNATSYAFTDADAEAGKTYAYTLRSVDYDGKVNTYTAEVRITVETGGTQAFAYELFQNYPNPFNPETTIRFTMKQAGAATIRVYDTLGRTVLQTTLNASRGANLYRFDASRLSSGIYFYKLAATGFESKALKMTVIK